MDAATRDLVRQRAGDCCEYCRIPQEAVPLISFHVEHIIAKQHQLNDDPANLALACDRCNAFKGPNLSSIDPHNGQIVELFHPRQDRWDDHFLLRGAQIHGITATGRATVRLLNMNHIRRVELRQQWIDEGREL